MKRAYIVNLQRLEMPAPTVYVPYIDGMLRAYIDQHEDLRTTWRFGPAVWRMQGVEKMMARFDPPDLVGFSVYVWNFQNSIRLAEAIKTKWPACRVVFGGPHVPNEPSDFFERHPFVDVCVHGEGEQTFRDLLRALNEPEPDLASVRGVSYVRDGRQVFTAPAERMKVLDVPGPYQSGYFNAFMEEIEALRDEMPVHVLASLETSRGCPYSCTFCDWGMSTMSKIRQHSEDWVRGELDWISANGITTVILNDSNFGVFERDIKIMEYVADLKRRTGFPQAFYPLGFAKNNKDRAFRINQIIHDEGFDTEGFNVNFSLQTLSNESLEAIGRKNIPLEGYRSLSDTYFKSGYSLSPDLIIPLPGETTDSFKEGYADLASWPHVKRIRIYPCTILPNAPMAKPEYRERWGLKTVISSLDPQRGLRADDPELLDEKIETVLATNTMSELDVAEAKLFVAVVNALEVYGITRPLRAHVQRLTGYGGGVFYDALMRWQLANEGVMANVIASVWERMMAGPSYADQIAWSGASTTWDGLDMQLHKTVAYDVLTRAHRFVEELHAFVREQFDLPADADLEELLAFQADTWVLPGHDATQARTHTYNRDWPTWIRSGEHVAGPITVTFDAHLDWVADGYEPTVDGWLRFALAQSSVDSNVVDEPLTPHVEMSLSA